MNSSRIDCIIVWSHGILHIQKILKEIRSHPDFRILYIHLYNKPSIHPLIKAAYSYDYAPRHHLKYKLKYLKKLPPKAYLIFFENIKPEINYYGDDDYRHLECSKLKKFKEALRQMFNPRDHKGFITHDHIIHATDNQVQANILLKFVGFKNGVTQFLQNKYFTLQLPWFLDKPKGFEIREIPIVDLRCNQAFIDKKGRSKLTQASIVDSVQFQALDNPQVYNQYLQLHRGKTLKADYDLDKYLKMSENFQYLAPPHETSFIYVKHNLDNSFIILDGLHRASLHYKSGATTVLVCILIYQ
ncbi:hypothetical protein OAE41_00245 [bacterium]|nr:hypothetical protein [bacterium]